MEDINKPRAASLFSFEALLSLIVLFVTMMAFKDSTTSESFSGEAEQRLSPYKFFMLFVVIVSFLILLVHGAGISKGNLFLWYAVFYAVVAMISTIISGLYPMIEWPFKFIRLSYWVWVMIISYYSVLQLNTLKYHVAIVYIFLLILFFLFFILMETQRGVFRSMLALNPVFYISFLMPAILLIRSKIFKISGLLLIFIAILLSYKRSAILAFVTSIPVYLYARNIISTSARLKKLMLITFGGVFLLVLLGFTFEYISSAIGLDWGTRLEDVTTSGGSGRIDKYLGYMGLLGSQSIYHWIVGYGYYATGVTIYNSPHNDILEVLYDFGLVGLAFYSLFIVQLVKTFFDMKRCKYKHFDAFAVSLVIFFWGTMLSMLIIVPFWILNLSFFWGWVIADFHNAKRYGDPERIGNPLYVYMDYEDDLEEYFEPAFYNETLV